LKAFTNHKQARDIAELKGIIIADTKFEFGVNENDEVVLADEVLTPDSSRFWQSSKYEAGKPQESYDKQYLRNWLTKNKLAQVEDVEMPSDVVEETKNKYIEAWQQLIS